MPTFRKFRLNVFKSFVNTLFVMQLTFKLPFKMLIRFGGVAKQFSIY